MNNCCSTCGRRLDYSGIHPPSAEQSANSLELIRMTRENDKKTIEELRAKLAVVEDEKRRQPWFSRCVKAETALGKVRKAIEDMSGEALMLGQDEVYWSKVAQNYWMLSTERKPDMNPQQILKWSLHRGDVAGGDVEGGAASSGYPFTKIKKQFPKGSQVLHVGLDPLGELCVWTVGPVHVPGGDAEIRSFEIYGTGWELDGNKEGVYIGSALVGGFMWHVWETTPGVQPRHG